MLRLVLILLMTSSADQVQVNVEQVALNYFATEIFAERYPDSKRIYFSGLTENEKSIAGPFSNCFESDSAFGQFYHQHKKSASEKLIIETDNFPQFRRSSKYKSKQLNLEVYRAVVNDRTVYVYLKVFKERQFVDHYLVKISPSNNAVVEFCSMNEVI